MIVYLTMILGFVILTQCIYIPNCESYSDDETQCEVCISNYVLANTTACVFTLWPGLNCTGGMYAPFIGCTACSSGTGF